MLREIRSCVKASADGRNHRKVADYLTNLLITKKDK